MRLFRVLFPAWKFFTDVVDLPILYYRIAGPPGDFGAWIVGLEKPTRRWYSIFFNPEGNLYLALNSLLQQVESDIGDLKPDEVDRFEETASFRLMLNLVRSMISERGQAGSGSTFQFKLIRRNQADLAGDFDELFLTSKTYRLK